MAPSFGVRVGVSVIRPLVPDDVVADFDMLQEVGVSVAEQQQVFSRGRVVGSGQRGLDYADLAVGQVGEEFGVVAVALDGLMLASGPVGFDFAALDFGGGHGVSAPGRRSRGLWRRARCWRRPA